ncbi:sigma-70 family RNA polymerase sigma factor [Cryobacterium sp. TMT2-10]|uniref:RNA polymerase sigma factor n=1 Tax=Cryobacterium sp. TMT2-10 TaxID=1259244 RepID=UPI00106AD3A4|nr:sigma-70 family RNA polymerase sigma factor [Cryobacterium sp. TMT2-10]TFD43811.1 sigma-70 family RNA polymerase sigma factor [Cryobacterium sp. TMT2-10]
MSSAADVIGNSDGEDTDVSEVTEAPLSDGENELPVDALIEELEVDFHEANQVQVTFKEFISDGANRGKLLAYGWRLTGDRDETADLIQQVMVTALHELRARPRYVGEFVSLIRRAMYNKFIEQIRKKARDKARGDYGDSLDEILEDTNNEFDVVDVRHGLRRGLWRPEERAVASEAQLQIWKAISQLLPQQQVVVTLALGLHPDRRNEPLSQTQIAEYLNIPVDLVKRRWRYALPTLRFYLETFWNDWKNS